MPAPGFCNKGGFLSLSLCLRLQVLLPRCPHCLEGWLCPSGPRSDSQPSSVCSLLPESHLDPRWTECDVTPTSNPTALLGVIGRALV